MRGFFIYTFQTFLAFSPFSAQPYVSSAWERVRKKSKSFLRNIKKESLHIKPSGSRKVKTLRLATLAIHYPLNLRTAHLLINFNDINMSL